MFNLLAGAFMSFASIFSGLFGAHASSTPPHGMGSTTPYDMHMGSSTVDHRAGPGIVGTIESINGTTLTVLGTTGMHSASTTYTIDATNAKIIKQKVGTTTVSSLAQGDRVLVNGTVSGTSVTAKLIIDGIIIPPMDGIEEGSSTRPMHMGSSTRPYSDNSGDWNPGGPMKETSGS